MESSTLFKLHCFEQYTNNINKMLHCIIEKKPRSVYCVFECKQTITSCYIYRTKATLYDDTIVGHTCTHHTSLDFSSVRSTTCCDS